jgi:hypothetical protein
MEGFQEDYQQKNTAVQTPVQEVTNQAKFPAFLKSLSI